MIHRVTPDFWDRYHALPAPVQRLADKSFALLKANPRHPSLHFKKVGRYWSARVAIDYRAIGVDSEQGVIWFWIGSHADYDGII